VSTAPKRYRVYGLVLEGGIPLSCPRVAGRARIDVRLRPGHARRFEDARRLIDLPSKPQWFECRNLSDGATYLRWSGLFEFLISSDARTIEYRPLGTGPDESLTTYLLGQVLSFSLLSRGSEPLHATAVVVNGEAIAFLGDCGYGKSTLGAAFLARGFPILTDDVLTLEARAERWFAHAGPPRLKLFPAVAQKILARSDGVPLNTGTSKLVLPLTSREANSRAIPLKALYVLPGPGERHAQIGITALEGQTAFLEIIRAAFNLIRVDRERLTRQFTVASRLVRDVPIRKLVYPHRLSLLHDVCEAVIADTAVLRRSQRRIGNTN
jgi:hypothetical protein